MNFFKKEDILTFCWSNKKNRILIFIILTVLILFVFIWIYFYKNSWLSEISKITEYNYQNCEKNYNSKLDSFFVNNTYKRNIIQNILECEKMYDEINLFTELEYNVENKIESPFLYEYDFVNWTIEESWIYDYDIELNDNIDLEKSSFELYFSNDNLEWLEKIISNFPSKINWTLEEIISLLYIKNLYLNNKEIIVNSTINNNEAAVVCILGTGSNCSYFDGVQLHQRVKSLGYTIMDDASGNYYGKQLIRDYYFNHMPEDISVAFAHKYNVEDDYIKYNLYSRPFFHQNYMVLGQNI